MSQNEYVPPITPCSDAELDNPIDVFDMIDSDHASWQGNELVFGAHSNLKIDATQEFDFGLGNMSVHIGFYRTERGGTQVLFDKRYEHETVQGICLFLYGDELGFQLGHGLSKGLPFRGSWLNYMSGVTVSMDEWHLATVTVARDNPLGGNIYLDGNLIHIFNPTTRAGSWDTDVPMYLGRRSSSASGYFSGKIGLAFFYHCVLSAEQVLAFYQRGLSNEA